MKHVLILLLLSFSLHAVFLSGTIYDSDTDQVAKNILMKFSGVNTYQYFSKTGNFSINVVSGNYTVTLLDIMNDTVLRQGKEDISIDSDSVIDFLIFPSDGDNAYGINVSEVFGSENVESTLIPVAPSYSSYLWVYLIVFLVLCGMLYYHVFKKKAIQNSSTLILTSEEQLIYTLIKKEKIVSQKELRKNVSFSEARVSMILSSLEEKGILKRIKKGNANELELL